MQKFLKYLGAFCLLSIAASLTFCSMGVYQGMKTANRIFAGADNYTCRQFLYDLEQPETDKFAPLIIATAAYGTSGGGSVDEAREQEITAGGMEPAIKKMYALCKGKPSERVLNLFAAGITGVSGTAIVSGTAVTSPTAAK